jgi:ABC-2 type transport system permease protein
MMTEQREVLSLYFGAFRAQFGATLAWQFQYRAALVIWVLWTVLQPLMLLSVWSAIARSSGPPQSNGGGGQVGGYTPEDFAGYFLINMWVMHLTFNGVLASFEGRVRRGDFSPLLLRPIHPISADVADNVAFKLLTLPVLVLATLVLFPTFRPRIDPPTWAVVAFVPALVLAYVVQFAVTWTVALSAFWLTRTQAVTFGYVLLLRFLAGQVAPLSLFPGWVQTLAWLSPFRWMSAFPTEVLLGRLSAAEALGGLGMQLVWSVASVVLLAPCWAAAVRRYTAVEG